MAHPYSGVRQNKVEHSRVKELTSGYAGGGDIAQDKKLIRKMIGAHESRMHMSGGEPKARADRPMRAKGGRVKNGKTTINVVINGGTEKPPMPMPMPMAPPMPPPRPPMPPAAAMPPGPPVPMGGPGVGPPIRSHGGRTYAAGGAVKSGVGWTESERLKTPVQHAPGKNDGKNLERGRPITYKKGGKIKKADGGLANFSGLRAYREMDKPRPTGQENAESALGGFSGLRAYSELDKPKINKACGGATMKEGGAIEAPGPGKGMGPKLPGGGRGGLARLAKAKRAAARH